MKRIEALSVWLCLMGLAFGQAALASRAHGGAWSVGEVGSLVFGLVCGLWTISWLVRR